MQRPKLFKNLTNFTVENFVQFLLVPMRPWVELSRINLSSNLTGATNPVTHTKVGRGCKLGTAERILRWLFILQKVPLKFCELLFDQSKSTTSKDFFHVNVSCAQALGNAFLSPPDPSSDDFKSMVGGGVFRNFESVSRAADVVKVCTFHL